ncbi:hypothetical protein BIW11_09966 [Tropilaelaps mercedesae]|uniref:Secreted protein n=1 Tax=Tropilaelaps mercedesae TaxID=418985 RepID=A0A1V9XHS1_9ACAR|nr:hypothetical protein BIW11_09966 [Tropilaelaps mercedesae]
MTRMIKTVANIICVAAVVSLGPASTTQPSNDFMDYLLRLISNEAEQYKLEAVRAADFNISVNSNWFTNRVFKAKFQNGFVRGLSRVSRKDNCQPTRWTHGNITLACELDLSRVIVTYVVAAKGHTLNPRTDWMDVYVKVETGTALFETQSLPNKPPHIKTFIIKPPLVLSVERVARKSRIDLNEGRSADFNRQVIREVKRVVQDAVMSTYLSILSRVMTKYSDVLILPPVV